MLALQQHRQPVVCDRARDLRMPLLAGLDRVTSHSWKQRGWHALDLSDASDLGLHDSCTALVRGPA